MAEVMFLDSPISNIVGGTVRQIGKPDLLPVVPMPYYGLQQSSVLFRSPRSVLGVGPQHMLPSFGALCPHPPGSCQLGVGNGPNESYMMESHSLTVCITTLHHGGHLRPSTKW